jgi:hypothetical protein
MYRERERERERETHERDRTLGARKYEREKLGGRERDGKSAKFKAKIERKREGFRPGARKRKREDKNACTALLKTKLFMFYRPPLTSRTATLTRSKLKQKPTHQPNASLLQLGKKLSVKRFHHMVFIQRNPSVKVLS